MRSCSKLSESRSNCGFHLKSSASTGDVNFLCGGMRNRPSHPCVLDCAHSSSSVHIHFGSRGEMSLSPINRMEKSPRLWTNKKEDPWELQFQRDIHKHIRLLFEVLRWQTSLCRFLANRLFVVLWPHFPTCVPPPTLCYWTPREPHSPLLELPCQQRHEQKQSIALPWPWCPLHLFFSGAQKPKRCPGLGLFYAFLSSVFFTVIALLVKTIQGVHAIEISAIRCFFQMLFVVPLLIYKKWVP